jgi:hypothetical protein
MGISLEGNFIFGNGDDGEEGFLSASTVTSSSMAVAYGPFRRAWS